MKLLLESASFEFSQDGNCLDETDAIESLTIEAKSSLGIDRDEGQYFYVIKSDSWSIDSVEDLQELFDRIGKSLKK